MSFDSHRPFFPRRLLAVAVGVVVAALLVGFVVVSVHRSLARSAQGACDGLSPQFVGQTLPRVDLAKLKWSGQGLVESGRMSLGPGAPFPYLMSFWSASCPPCIREMPSLVELGRRAWQGAVVLVCVDDDLKGASDVIRNNPGLLQAGFNVVWLWDKGGRLARRMGTRKFPETYFVSEGTARWKVVSERDWMSMPARHCLLAHH